MMQEESIMKQSMIFEDNKSLTKEYESLILISG